MKNKYTVIYITVMISAIVVLGLTSHVGENTAGPGELSVDMDAVAASVEPGSDGELPAGRAGLGDMSNALYTIDESSGRTGDSLRPSPEPTADQDFVTGPGSLRHAELIARANRIMEALYRDGFLPASGSNDSAWAPTASYTDQANHVIERFRLMHLQHLALLSRALVYGDGDSLVVLGWSRISLDVAAIHRMAAEMRNETALAPRILPSAGLPLQGRFTHLYRAENFDTRAVKVVP